MTYYAHAAIELRWAINKEVINDTERKVIENLGSEPTRKEWVAVGPSQRVNGQNQWAPWEFGEKLPYWARWVEFWAYVE